MVFKRFKVGLEDIQDDKKTWRPSTTTTVDTIANIHEMMIRDCRWALRMIVDELNISKETVRQILR
jgi:hypothetical protein